MHIRVSVAYLEIAQSYIPAIFNGYISHLAVYDKNRISAVENKIRHAARYGSLRHSYIWILSSAQFELFFGSERSYIHECQITGCSN